MGAQDAAAEEYRYLLDRGYNPPSVLRLVGERHLLDARELNVLRRQCFAREDAEDIRRRAVPPSALRGRRVAVDLYNVLITSEADACGEAFECDDGFVRDARGVYGKYRIGEATAPALRRVIGFLASLGAAEARALLDSQVSMSGELAALARGAMAEAGLPGEAKVLKDVDASLRRLGRAGWVVATSDAGIVRYVPTAVDLPGGMRA